MQKPASTPALPRFVELIRVSTKDQAERNTPADQRAALDRLRASRPGVLVERIETAVSGAKSVEDRPDLLRLEELAASGGFDEVRVRHFDRLTRSSDPDEQDRVSRMLRKAGAVVVEADGTVTDPRTLTGRVITMIKQEGAAEERKRIWERTFQGRQRMAAEGRLAQGQPPYGRTFNTETGAWGTDPGRAKVYRRMFEMVLAGRSLAQIAEQLNSESIATVRGRPWCDASVSRLLRDEAAFGKYTTHGRTFTVPAVVDEATFLSVRARLKENNSLSGPRPKVFALLRKLATCGECGAPMYLQLGGGTPARFRYYYCSAHDPKCHVYHRVADVDGKVVETLRGWLHDPDTLAAAAGLDAPGGDRIAAENTLADCKAALARLDKREVNTARMLSAGDIQPKTARVLLSEIKTARASVLAQQAAAQAQLGAVERYAADAAGLAATIKRLRKGLAKETPEGFRGLVEIIFRRGGIRIFKDGEIKLAGRVALGARLPKLPGALETT